MGALFSAEKLGKIPTDGKHSLGVEGESLLSPCGRAGGRGNKHGRGKDQQVQRSKGRERRKPWLSGFLAVSPG